MRSLRLLHGRLLLVDVVSTQCSEIVSVLAVELLPRSSEILVSIRAIVPELSVASSLQHFKDKTPLERQVGLVVGLLTSAKV